jgi:hypothetical protein
MPTIQPVWNFALIITLLCLVVIVLALEITQYISNRATTGPTGYTGRSGNTGLVIFPGPNISTGQYGDGHDGNLILLNETITLEKDMFYNRLVLQNSTIHTRGFRIFSEMLDTTGGAPSYLINHGHTGDGNTGIFIHGGLGGDAGTLGGGATGGAGYLKFHDASHNGDAIWNALFSGSSTTSFGIGADSPLTDQIAPYGQGLGGAVASLPARSTYDLVCALNSSFSPDFPMLAGGSGGGGGQGATTFPGSGGGGGGGLILLASNSLNLPSSSPLVVNVKGGDAGRVFVNGPLNSTSGGGGGGGSFVLLTNSDSASYLSGLQVQNQGGSFVAPDTSIQQAKAGLFVDFYHPQNSLPGLVNPQPIWNSENQSTFEVPNDTISTVPVPTIIQSYGFQYRLSDDAVIILQDGTFLFNFQAASPVTANGIWTVWIAVNNNDTTQYGLASELKDVVLSQQLTLQKNDFIQIRVRQSSGSDLVLDGTDTPISLYITCSKV